MTIGVIDGYGGCFGIQLCTVRRSLQERRGRRRSPPKQLKVAICGHFHVQRDGRRAREKFVPFYLRYISNNLPRGHTEMSSGDYEAASSPRGATIYRLIDIQCEQDWVVPRCVPSCAFTTGRGPV
jgi:hypothetical protein